MKTLFLTSIVSLLISSHCVAQWIQQPSGTTKGLYTIYFLNQSTGWIAGEDGTILKTTDSGENWISQSISTLDNIRSIFFTDSLNGWIALYEWTPIRHGSIYHTTNGGSSWFSQLTVSDYGLLSLHFTDNLHGWVVGTNGIMYRTTNGGNSWQYLPNFTDGWLYSERFVNNNTGWVVGDLFGNIAKTTNGGNSWFMQNIPTYNYLIDVYFIDQSFGWAVGQSGTILKTTNSGSNWTLQPSGVTNELRDVQFVNEQKGWVSGFGGVIIHSTDGGISWSTQNSSTTVILYALSFVDDTRGWAVGDNGTILKTINGGVTVEPNIFEKTFGGIGSELGIGIDKTSDGGYVIVGSTESFTSNEIMYVIQLDSSGSLVWSKAYNAYGFDRLHAVKRTPDGGYYLSGFVEGGFGLRDHLIMKIDSFGNIIWAKNFGGVQAEELRKLSLTSDGGLLVSGYNASFGAGAKDVQAIKLSSNGTIDWAKTYGTFYEDFSSSNIVASDGNYILSGAFDLTGNYSIRPTLIKLDTLGNIIWAKYYSGTLEDWGRNLTQSPEGGYLLAADANSYGYGGSRDICLIKTDVSGNVEWAKAYGGIGEEEVRSVILTSDSKYVISGFTNSFGFGGNDAFLMKVDLNGSLEWFHTYGGYTNDYGADVVETFDQGFALTGRRSSNTFGGEDVYLIKTDNDGFSNCAFGTFNPNVFTISNLQAINLNMSTLSTISAANLTLTTITPNSAQTTSCAIIPVELKSFNYRLENQDVVLTWSTATETNNMGFKVFRNDIEIGFVTGSGTTTEPRQYSFKDQDIFNGSYIYSLIQIDYDGTTYKFGELEVTVNNIPSEYVLDQNYPNPFNSNTIIGFALPRNVNLKLSVFNTLGENVVVLEEGFREAGYYQTEFDGSNLHSGIYFYTLTSDNFISTKKMILLK